ncbi:MAG TPA: ATP-binding protein [Anaerolineae bacterium]|nr:ATP-binding protein [Anaerolineae bacterium]
MPEPTAPIPDLEERVHQALITWYSAAPQDHPLRDLALVQQIQAALNVSLQRAANLALEAALESLARDASRDARLLRRRFVDERPVFVVAREFSMAEATFYKHQRRAIAALTATLAELEQDARSQHRARAEARLPWLDNGQIFGLQPLLDRLTSLLSAPEPGQLITVLTGLGGVGKTTAARHALEQIVQGAAAALEVGWVSAQQQTFHPGGGIRPVDRPALTADDLLLALTVQLLPAEARVAPLTSSRSLAALQTLLRQTPHLVVIDNLETVADVESLLPTLRRLAGPSRFLLTSRRALPHEPGIYHLTVPELAEPDALALVRHEARMRNLATVSQADDAELRPLYDTVGGNPLTLKLAVGMLFLLPLPQVVDNLRRARGHTIGELYRYIYWQAWNQLDGAGQEVLLCMPNFAQNGADFASIQRICELREAQLSAALERLAMLSLVNVAGDLHDRRYSIHRLTETFLLREVIRWQGLADDQEDEWSLEQGP